MVESVNDNILDSFAEHDIDLRKLDGHIRNQVDKILLELGRDLKALLVRIDPNGAQRSGAKRRRIKKLREESRSVISAAYRDIAALVRKDLRRLSKLESRAALSIIEDNLP